MVGVRARVERHTDTRAVVALPAVVDPVAAARRVLRDHLVIAAKAARRENHTLGLNGVCRAVVRLRAHAGDAAILAVDQLRGLCAQQRRAALSGEALICLLIAFLGAHIVDVLAARIAVHRLSRYRRAGHRHQRRHVAAAAGHRRSFSTGHRALGACAHHVAQLGEVQTLREFHAAAHQRLDAVAGGRDHCAVGVVVEVDETVRLAVRGIVPHSVRAEAGVVVDTLVLFDRRLDGGLIRQRAEHLRAAGEHGLAAPAERLFDVDDVQASLLRGQGGDGARSARAHDDHVAGQRLLLLLRRGRSLDKRRGHGIGCIALAQSGGHVRLRERVAHGVLDARGGAGRAGHAVHADGLRCEDRRLKLRKRALRHIGVFVGVSVHLEGVRKLDGHDARLIDRHLHGDLVDAAEAVRAAGVGARQHGGGGLLHKPRLLHSLHQRSRDGVARHRRAGDGLDRAVLYDSGFKRIGGLTADGRGFTLRRDVASGDGTVLHRDGDCHGAAEAVRRARELLSAGCGKQHDRKQRKPFFHDTVPSFPECLFRIHLFLCAVWASFSPFMKHAL